MLAILSFTIAYFLQFQNLQQDFECKVALPAIQGFYEGGCKKGLADGLGKAIGVDTFHGDFRKGLPHGQGKYSWANGDFYLGEWKKGKKDGAGSWYVKEENITMEGYWVDDEYIGTEKDPYKVLNKSMSITRMNFNRQKSEPYELDFNITYLGKPLKFTRFSIQDSFGVKTQETDYTKTVTVYDFPVKGTIAFEVNINGSGDQSGEVFFQINQSGQWSITIEVRET